jgi:hypothetical protein
MPLTPRELVDPLTLPNPWIKKLMDLTTEIIRDMPNEPAAVLFEYAMAREHILKAVVSLYAAKNILAGEGLGKMDVPSPIL